MHVGHRIPAGAAVQAVEPGLRHVVHPQVGVQGGGEIPCGVAGVVGRQFDLQVRIGQFHRQAGSEAVRPPGAGLGRVVQRQDGAHAAVVRAALLDTPRQVAGEAVLGERAALVELGKADRHAAADRTVAVKLGAGAEVEALCPAGRNPGEHLRALQGDDGGCAAGQRQVQRGESVERRVAHGLECG